MASEAYERVLMLEERVALLTGRVETLEAALQRMIDVGFDGYEAYQAARRALDGGRAPSVSGPLTGAELAAKHGFEPVPDWKKDPFVRPMVVLPINEEAQAKVDKLIAENTPPKGERRHLWHRPSDARADLDEQYRIGWREGAEDAIDAICEPGIHDRSQCVDRIERMLGGQPPALPSHPTREEVEVVRRTNEAQPADAWNSLASAADQYAKHFDGFGTAPDQVWALRKAAIEYAETQRSETARKDSARLDWLDETGNLEMILQRWGRDDPPYDIRGAVDAEMAFEASGQVFPTPTEGGDRG